MAEYHLNLHGINRRQSVSFNEEDETKQKVDHLSRSLKHLIMQKSLNDSHGTQSNGQRSRSGSVFKNAQGSNTEVDLEKGELPPNRAISATRRRHSIAAARKNGSWADVFLSVAACEIGIAAFVTFKDCKDVDAEYFYNLIPKAVVTQDLVYKELLGVYNAFKYWGPRVFLGRRIFVSMTDPDALKLLKSDKLNSKSVSPQKLLILKEISEICRRQCIEIRASLSEEPKETMVYYLANSHMNPMRTKFNKALAELHTSKENYEFVAVEKLFPPSYV